VNPVGLGRVDIVDPDIQIELVIEFVTHGLLNHDSQNDHSLRPPRRYTRRRVPVRNTCRITSADHPHEPQNQFRD
jgi:hypothetical protein